MSNDTLDSQNTVTTIWYKRGGGISPRDPVTYETVLINTCFSIGGESKYQDRDGQMIVPKSRYWFEVIAENPRRGDYIARGDFSLTTSPNQVAEAEEIRFTRIDDCSILGEADDFYLET